MMTICLCGDNKSAKDYQPDHLPFEKLRQAAFKNCFGCVEWLLRVHKADVNSRDFWGNDALHMAITGNHFKMIRLLLECGALIDSTCDGKCRGHAQIPHLDLAILRFHNTGRDVVCLLLDRGATSYTTNELVSNLRASRKNCLKSTLTFLGIRRRITLVVCRDTHTLVAKILWSSRWNEAWLRNEFWDFVKFSDFFAKYSPN